MFALLRHVGHTSRYELPPRPSALHARRNAPATTLQAHLAEAQRHVPSFGKILKSIHFSVLPAADCGTVILLNEQVRAALRALGEQPGLTSALLVVAAVVWATVAR